MKNFKLLLSFCLLLALSFSYVHLTAQSQQLPKWEVRAGAGLLPTFLKDHVKTDLLPVSLEVRYRPQQRFSLGLLAGNSISQATITHHTGEERMVRNNFRMVALRGAVHNNTYEKFDIYGGIVLGYTNSNVEYEVMAPPIIGDPDPSAFPIPRERSGLMFSAFVGTQYQVYKNFSVFGELSYGLSLATLGASYKF